MPQPTDPADLPHPDRDHEREPSWRPSDDHRGAIAREPDRGECPACRGAGKLDARGYLVICAQCRGTGVRS